jgi:hypothetical protein
MATLKNPSIYDDRSTIGSADELDEYGVWVKIEPKELSEAGEDSFPDFDADFVSDLPQAEVEDTVFEDLDYSREGEDAGFDDVEALRQDIQSVPLDGPAMDILEEPPAFDDAPTAGPPPSSTAELSTQLLIKIVDSLSAIKDDLSAIKGDIAALRSEKPARSAGTDDSGFFGEDEDDKIALTGDELDNIIQTAAFTEETGVPLVDDFASEEAPEPGSGGGEIIFDGLGRPLQTAASQALDEGAPGPATTLEATTLEATTPEATTLEATALEATAPEAAIPDYEGEIIYDGLGRPLNRKISGDDPGDPIFLDADKEDELKALQENGVEPMTIAPEDTSYLEEDPLVEGDFDPPPIMGGQDLDEAPDMNPEEPSPEDISLIDLETIAPSPAMEEERLEEKPLFEDVSFEDLPDLDAPLDSEDMIALENVGEEETIDLSVFEDDFLLEEGDADGLDTGDLSFEVLDENTDLPVQENVQDNVISEDSFESISLEDDEEIADLALDKDLEQTLSKDINIDLDFPLIDEEIAQDPQGEDDKNFDLPGPADSAISTEEVPPAIKMELRDVLAYMDKLLEALPEEKINEFAQSEHYATYKQLIEELGIQQ